MGRKIALSSGHHNTTGGDAREKAMTGRVTPVVAQALRAAGYDVRVITPDNGAGEFPGDVWDVGHKVVEWSQGGWRADMFIEFHGQWIGNPLIRGQFVIYPDWPKEGDLDVSVRDSFGPLFVQKLQAATGVPVTGDGTLSERDTQVGSDGFRLGIFNATKGLAPHTLRLIAEIMTYSNPQDTAIMLRDDYPLKVAHGVLDALEAYYNV